MGASHRYIFEKFIPVAPDRRVELVSAELARELIAAKKYELRAYVELGITTAAWICLYCEEVYLCDVDECPACAQWYFYERGLSSYERARVLSMCKYRCWYCGAGLDSGATVDHQQARARGGGHQPENLVAACRRCNSRKGKRSVSEYREYLQRLSGGQVRFFGERMGASSP